MLAEFKAYTKDYYIQAIQDNRVTINGNKTTLDYTLKNNDLLVHRTMRVEPPILDLEVRIIEENDDLLIVNKPAGMTIHTGGGFSLQTTLLGVFVL